MAHEYNAVKVQQTSSSAPILLFAAPASEIVEWVGIPQRRRVGDNPEGAVESVGFQREESPSRITEIARFMSNVANVIQNPLLGAVQITSELDVVDEDQGFCKVRISPRDHRNRSLLEIIQEVREALIARMPALGQRPIQLDRLAAVRRATAQSETEPEEAAGNVGAGEGQEPSVEVVENGSEGASIALFDEETQVIDFFDQVNARTAVLQELGEDGADLETIAGFSRDFLESMIMPVVLVDGQHRLRGALRAVDDALSSAAGQEKIAQMINKGLTPETAERELRRENDRLLPVSLLWNDSPAEHVFQFVVVNQKATPMSPALLGTIVSTSLSKNELDPIALRLREAGIELEDSRAVAFLTRSLESPFRNLVSTGVRGDRPGSLPWSVLRKLVNIVRNLEGGALFHTPNIDYARMWRTKYLAETGLLPADVEPESRIEAWASDDGPWRRFFIMLHTAIRDKFGDADDMSSHNAWGTTKSNLFNLISLSILTADFFAFLHERSQSLPNWDSVAENLDNWIGDLNSAYFNRDWRMGGTKKDQPAIRRAWADAWFEYRTVRERLPRAERYNPGGIKS